MFYEALKIAPGYPLEVAEPRLLQILQEKPYGCVVELKGVGTPVLAIKMEKVVLGELNSRQASFFKLGGELFEGF